MRSLVIAALVAPVVLTAAAQAADLQRPVYKAPVVAAAYNWSGFYIGLHAGYGWGEKDWTQTFSSGGFALDRSSNSLNPDGFLGGAQIGVNWQTGAWVYGIEADGSWTSAKGCSALVIFSAYDACSRVDWYATGTARVGYAYDRLLPYLKGGVAFAGERHHETFVGNVDTLSSKETRVGWTIGAGIEYGLAPNWSVKIEYGYMDFGSDSTTIVFTSTGSSPGLIERWDIDQKVHVVKGGVNYRF
jgi:outer membrane immunogenic protein